MAIRLYKSYTPGTRNRTVSTFSEITSSISEKSLTSHNHSPKGHNNRGVITCRHKGGGHKKRYREIDFQRKIRDIPAIVKDIHYDRVTCTIRVKYYKVDVMNSSRLIANQ